MAEQLQEETNLRVELATGRLGEFRVTLDGEDLFSTSRLRYPRTRQVMDAVRGLLPG